MLCKWFARVNCTVLTEECGVMEQTTIFVKLEMLGCFPAASNINNA